MQFTAKITSGGRTQHAWQIEALSHSNARITAKAIKDAQGYTGLLTVTSTKPRKGTQKEIFPFTVEIYKLDSRQNEIMEDGEPVVITIPNLPSKEEAIKEGHRQSPNIGCMGYKIVVLENGEEVYCKPVMF